MKLSTEINDLLVELIDIESIDCNQFLFTNADFLCQQLLMLYGKTSNEKSHDLIIEIIDKGGYSFFGARLNNNHRSNVYDGHVSANLIGAELNVELSEDDFLDLLPVNGYFH